MFHTETKREQKKWTGAGRENRLSGIIWAVCSKLLRTVSKQRRNLRGVCECKCGKCLLRDFLPRGSSTAAKNTPYFSRHFPDVFCVTSKDKHTHSFTRAFQTDVSQMDLGNFVASFIPFSILNDH